LVGGCEDRYADGRGFDETSSSSHICHAFAPDPRSVMQLSSKMTVD
jgi:hypothetical protein